MKVLVRSIFASLSIVSLVGCTTMGVAPSDYSCNAPDGVSCTSVSGVHANYKTNNLPHQTNRNTAVSGDHDSVVSDYDSDDLLVDKHSVPTNKEVHKPGLTPSQGSFLPISKSTLIGPGVSPQSLLQQNRVLQVMIYPWEDSNGVLYDSSYLYLIIKEQEWKLPHVKEQRSTPSFGSTFDIGG